MGAFKNKDNGTWIVQFRYVDWRGENKQVFKRGFATKKEAQEYEREFRMQKSADVTMNFATFVELYEKDIRPSLKENTWLTKEHIIKEKILPYFSKKRLCDIAAKDVIAWQNEMRNATSKGGKKLSQTYLKTIHNQLSALFNHAVRFYGLKVNPAATVGNMGKAEYKEMLFWTTEEYTKFANEMMDKPLSYYAFQMLYWCGIRVGDADGKISLNQQKPSKHAGLRRFGPEKFLQRNNEFMKERPIFYKKPIKTEKDFSTWLRCFYYTTKAVITEYIYF